MSGPARAAPLLVSVCHRVRATRRLQRKVAKTADGRGLAISVTVGETAVLKAFPGADALWAARAGRSVTNPSRKGRRTCAPTKRKPRCAGQVACSAYVSTARGLGESESRPARLG